MKPQRESKQWAVSPAVPFLANGGEMGALMRAHDWQATALGSPDTWPQPLRTMLRLLLNTGHPMYIWWGPELLCFYNDAYRQSIGTDRHPSSLGRPAREVWAEIWPIIGPQIDQVMSGRGPTWNENHLVPITRNGCVEQVYWTYSYSPIDDETAANGVGGVLVVCAETSEQVLARQRMQAAEARWRQLFDQAPGFMCVLNGPQHQFEYCNPRYFEVAGRSDILGKTVLEALPEVEEQGFIKLLDRVYQTGEAHIATAAPIHIRRSSEPSQLQLQLRYLDFVYQPIRNALGAVTGIFVEGADVTERVLASRALAESETRFRTLADNIPVLCWMADRSGAISWYNGRWYEYTGSTPEQMQGWGWQSVHDPRILPEVLERWRASIANGTAFEMVFPLKSASGEFRPFLTRIVPFLDAQGSIARWFGIHADITQQLAAESVLREADRRKDEFLATLAHELRNPLAPVRNAARILRTPLADTTRQWAAEVIERQIQAMGNLLDDLLDLSRVTRGHLTLHKELTQLSAIVDAGLEVARPLIDSRQHVVTVSLPQAPIELMADPLRLSQVFSNLLTNAAKYMEKGGRIEISATADHDGVDVVVKDHGIGLEPHSLLQIFEMFSQVKGTLDRSDGGLGIGLALVKGLVSLHGGWIEARSEGLGRGSEFSVWLPLAVVSHREASPARNSDDAAPTALRQVLVVDDNLDGAQSLGFVLQGMGHEVSFAHDGEQAIAVARERRPQVAVVDIGLPKLNGYDVARAIRREAWGSQMVLIALTGWGNSDDKRRAHEAGFNFHLTKPANPDQINAIICTETM